jgi:hypothetical protein
VIPSSKRIGKYEKELLSTLTSYFELRGFKAYPHVQLNISWGNIISDIDLVLESEDQLFGIEVKSSRDNFKKLIKQIDRMLEFFDGAYVATDNPKWMSRKELADGRIGVLIVNGKQIAERVCHSLFTKPTRPTMVQLRKICLHRWSAMLGSRACPDKETLVSFILNNMNDEHLRPVLKSIIMCERQCKTNCPLWIVEKKWIAPLKNVRWVTETYKISEKTLPLIPADINEKNSVDHPKTENDKSTS